MTDGTDQTCPECGHPLSEHNGGLGGLCAHEHTFDFCSCGDYYDQP